MTQNLWKVICRTVKINRKCIFIIYVNSHFAGRNLAPAELSRTADYIKQGSIRSLRGRKQGKPGIPDILCGDFLAVTKAGILSDNKLHSFFIAADPVILCNCILRLKCQGIIGKKSLVEAG